MNIQHTEQDGVMIKVFPLLLFFCSFLLLSCATTPKYNCTADDVELMKKEAISERIIDIICIEGKCRNSDYRKLIKIGLDVEKLCESDSGGGVLDWIQSLCCNANGVPVCPASPLSPNGSPCGCPGVPGYGFVCR